jgi:hypothetical protein
LSETVKTALVVPTLPSSIDTSSIEKPRIGVAVGCRLLPVVSCGASDVGVGVTAGVGVGVAPAGAPLIATVMRVRALTSSVSRTYQATADVDL